MIKKIVLFFAIATLFSCKKEGVTSKNNASIDIESNVQLSDVGDAIVGQQSFINELNDAANVKEKRKVLSKINFDYDKYVSWDGNSIEERKVGNISLKFRKDSTIKSQADIYSHIKLTVEKENKVADTLTLYKQENYAEALVAITQYFYIDTKMNIWTLAITEEEGAIYIQSWKQFKIDPNTGKIVFVKSSFSNQKSSTEVNLKSDIWSGKYFFKKENRDELVTSFDIDVRSLDAINITYVGDGEKPESYKNLKAEVVDKDKIKIQFNKKYDDFGIIYIQKEDQKYIISGEPISNINPGNDEYSIKKIE